MAATADVLADAGYDGLTMEEVATRAGVHKTTVYRRWPTKAELESASAAGAAATRSYRCPTRGRSMVISARWLGRSSPTSAHRLAGA